MGAVVYEVLTGTTPYQGRSVNSILAQVVKGPPEPPSRRLPEAGIPPELDRLVAKAMDRKRARRYRSVADLKTDLEAYLADRPIAAFRYSRVQRMVKWVRRNKAVAAFLAAVSILVPMLAVAFVLAVVARTDAQERARAEGLAKDEAREAEEEAREAEAKAKDLARSIEASAAVDRDYLVSERYVNELDGLWPAVPERIGAMEAWLEAAERLLEREADHRRMLQERETGSIESAEARWALDRHRELALRLETLGRGVKEIEERIVGAREFGREMQGYEGERRKAAAAIRADPRYGGLALELPVELVPIGRDAASGLWEFWHALSGERPVRGDDGRIRMAAESGIVLVLVPAGSFRMGSDSSQYTDEKPAHDVTVKAFLVSKYEMTQGQWDRAAGVNPSYYKGNPLAPVEQVSWEDCRRVLTRIGLRLPSEAQWEYAARAGTSSEWWTGDDPRELATAGNLADRTGVSRGLPQGEAWDDGEGAPSTVGKYRANPFGLHDTIGNVWEWCEDTYQESYRGAPVDGSAWVVESASTRVYRGGGYASLAVSARSALRLRGAPSIRDLDLGARPAMDITPP